MYLAVDQELVLTYFQLLYDYIIWGQYNERAEFRDGFKQKFGRNPYLNPVAQMRLASGAKMTSEHFDEIRKRRGQFQHFIESIFGVNSIMVSPFLSTEPEPRDVYRPA